MAKETNWHKHVAIGTYMIAAMTAVLIAIGIRTFTNPPDPLHPASFDSWSKPIALPPWLGISAIFTVIIGSVLVTRRRTEKAIASALAMQSASVSSALTPQKTPDINAFFHVHATSLERTLVPTPGLGYPAKLRFSLRNITGEVVKVLPLSWLTSKGNISVQVGKAPYLGVPYEDGMTDFSYRYQLEEYSGSWKSEKWKRLQSGAHDEQVELTVNPNETFRIWVGLNPCVPPANMENLRKTHSLGTIILPIAIGGKDHELSLQV